MTQHDRRNNIDLSVQEMADALWDKMIQCTSNIKEISLNGIPDEKVKIMKDVLENIWQNLRLHFDVDCTSVKNNQNLASPVTTVKKRLSKEVSNKNGSHQRKDTNHHNKLTSGRIYFSYKDFLLCMEGTCCFEPCSYYGDVRRNNAYSSYP